MKCLIPLCLLSACVTVPAGHKGVVTTGGKVTQVLDEGIAWGASYWLNPLVSVTRVSTQVQAARFTEAASSRDLQTVATEITLNWRRRVDDIQRQYEEYPSIKDRVVEPAVQESIKAVTAQYTADEIITQRPKVKAGIEALLVERLKPVGIDVEAVSITDFQFSKKFDEAIEAKMEAEQRALMAERQLQRIEIEAKQAVAAAEGAKQAAILNAQGEAESISIQGDALRKNPMVLELRRIEKWNGEMPEVLSTGEGMGMMKMLQ